MGGGLLTESLAPAAATVLCIVALLCFLLVRRVHARRAFPLPRCPQCRYVAAGLMGLRCPECGHDHDRNGVLPARTSRPLPLWLAIVLWLLMAGAVWTFFIEPVADRLSVARQIHDSIILTKPHSGAYDSMHLRARVLEWPVDLARPHGTWTLTLRTLDSEVYTQTFRSDDEHMNAAQLAAWIAQSAPRNEVTLPLEAEARAILVHAQRPGAGRGVIRFGVATRQNVGTPGPTQPFGDMRRRVSLQPVRLPWVWYGSLLGMILFAVLGIAWLIIRERRRRRAQARAWAAIRPTPIKPSEAEPRG